MAVVMVGFTLVAVWHHHHSPQRQWAAAVARGDAEHELVHVPLPTGKTGLVHCWKPAHSTMKMVFEQPGDRVMARAVPQTGDNH